MSNYDHHANVLLNKYFDGIESPERELCPWCEEWTAVEHSYCQQMIREHTCSACGEWFYDSDYHKGEMCECGKGRLGETNA